jgi:hypothetical protein
MTRIRYDKRFIVMGKKRLNISKKIRNIRRSGGQTGNCMVRQTNLVLENLVTRSLRNIDVNRFYCMLLEINLKITQVEKMHFVNVCRILRSA